LTHLVEVAFKGNRKEFFHWSGDEPPPRQAAVIVEADRGEDLGFVHATGDLAEKRVLGVAHRPTDEEPLVRQVQRLATPDEVKRAADLRDQDEIARRKAMERVKANNLVMKLTDAEWRWDRRKLTLYFTADKRVDFRTLVRELASMFRTRIELKQIGVRDEARRLGGIGRCGREYCSASWLPELRPVNLGVAKDQRLSLNPTQISGACGRLMCCLRYEHEFYVQQRKRFPKEGKLIETSKGEEKVISNDIFRERVTLRAMDGEMRVLSLADLRREWRNPNTGVGGQLMDEDTSPFPFEAITDEVLRLQDTSEMPAWRPDLARGGKTSSRELPLASASDRGGEATTPRAPSNERGAQKREARDGRRRAEGGAERGVEGARERDAEGDRREPRGRASSGSGDSAETPRPAAEPTPAEGGSASSASDRAGEEERRLRRRRGRRGGRRGRGTSDRPGEGENDDDQRGGPGSEGSGGRTPPGDPSAGESE